ncbi:hypothetical protein [Clostridium perfringens]|uniref:hypothetical protein n=1 Tax=Clostridium perfringens TaxID=1502 RepID=UPI0032DA36A6
MDLCYYIVSNIFSNLSRSELMQIDVFDFFETYIFIRKYVENIQDRIREIFVGNRESIVEKSAFDDYDRENGYLDEELEENIYDNHLTVINNIIQYSINNFKNSLDATLKMNIFDLLDYIEFDINNKNEEEIEE